MVSECVWLHLRPSRERLSSAVWRLVGCLVGKPRPAIRTEAAPGVQIEPSQGLASRSDRPIGSSRLRANRVQISARQVPI
jgi:hypothetical protein